MKRATVFEFIPVLVLLLTSGAAVATPVYPSMDLGSMTVTTDVQAIARAAGLVDDHSNSGANLAPTSVWASAYAPGTQTTPGSSQNITTDGSGLKVGTVAHGVVTSSAGYNSHDGANNHSFYASSWTHATFDIAIGTSADFAQSAPLVLSYSANQQVMGTEWATTDWSLTIGGLVIDKNNMTGQISVQAGQTFTGVQWNMLGQTRNAATADEIATFTAQVELFLTPEPATLTLLGLGGLALLRRRKR